MSTTAAVARPNAVVQARRPKTPGEAALGPGRAEPRRLAGRMLEGLAGKETPARATIVLLL